MAKRNVWQSFLVSGLLVLTFLLAACGDTTTPPTAQQLISNAQAAIRQVKSYHFSLVADNLDTGVQGVKSAEGDVVVPDKLKATASVFGFGGTATPLQIIAIGDKQYITNPITNAWQEAPNLIDLRKLANPQTGLAAVLGNIQNPSTPKESDVDGRACWSTDGQLDAKYLAGLIGGTATGKMVPTTTCIGKNDNLPYLIRMNGIIVRGDSEKTVRTFKFSNFNEDITITAPPIQ